jgi:hypothetical protein
VGEVDTLIAALGDVTLTATGLNRLAALARVRERYPIPADELAALVGTIPAAPAGRSLFDRLFNSRSLVAASGAYPDDTYHVILPAFRRANAAPADPALSRLTSALGLDLESLAILARALAPHLAQETHSGFDPDAASEDDRYFVLSVPNLTLLHRHARLARLLAIPTADLITRFSNCTSGCVRRRSVSTTCLSPPDGHLVSPRAIRMRPPLPRLLSHPRPQDLRFATPCSRRPLARASKDRATSPRPTRQSLRTLGPVSFVYARASIPAQRPS